MKVGDLVCFKPLMDKPDFDDRGIIIAVLYEAAPVQEYVVRWFEHGDDWGVKATRLLEELHLISECP